MNSGWIRAAALLAIAALFTNAQCYGKCTVAGCGSAQIPSGGCHHHKAPQHDEQDCTHHHSEFTTAEAGIAKADVGNWVPFVALPAVQSTGVLIPPPVLVIQDTGSPPDRLTPPTITVLRI